MVGGECVFMGKISIEGIWEDYQDETIKKLNLQIGYLKNELDTIHHTYKRKIEHLERAALEKFMGDLLPILDDIWQGALHDNSWKMLWEKLVSVLNQHGIEIIDKVDVAFNPMEHQVVAVEDGKGSSGKVAVVVRPGYKMGDFLLRPALVKVYK